MSIRARSTHRVDPWDAAAALSVAAACVLAFLPVLGARFVNFDDDVAIVGNAANLRLDSERIVWMLTSFHMGHWQPLSWVSLAVDHTLWGLDPFGFHLTNLLLHVVASWLVLDLARRLFAGHVDAQGAAHADTGAPRASPRPRR